MLLLSTLAFNLLQLFIYRSSDTIWHIVEVMLWEVPLLPEPIPWATLPLDTS